VGVATGGGPRCDGAVEPRVDITEADEGRTARLVLHASGGNPLDLVLVHALEQALDALGRWPYLTVAVIEGFEKDFSVGHPVSQLGPAFAPALLDAFHTVIRGVIHLDVPLIALVRGRCLGAGAALALAADVVVADSTARVCLCDAPGTPNPAAMLLASFKLERARASEALLSGGTYTGEEAAALGLVTECGGGWEGANALVDKHIRKLGQQQPPGVIREIMQTVRAPLHARLADDLPALEQAAVARFTRPPVDEATMPPKWRPR